MASWMLDCTNCQKPFQHSEIEDTLINRYFPAKPKFPESGAAFRCPHCGHQATYQQHHLTYSRD
jgi:DNA-directed RNA polymerase subunit RPC12/RpoP